MSVHYSSQKRAGSLFPHKNIPFQRWAAREEDVLQQQEESPTQHAVNTTGLPNTLKAGVESLSGLSLDDVRVHYRSSKPAQVQALAYAQGTEIYVAPGQERHLPHEAWHIVQQMQGRVQPTLHVEGAVVNDDQTLEHEADIMGARSAHIQTQLLAKQSTRTMEPFSSSQKKRAFSRASTQENIQREIIQRTVFSMGDDLELAKINAFNIAERTKDSVIYEPIPQLQDEDPRMGEASHPITILWHGRSLRKMGATEFARLLRKKGFVRRHDSEIVLISCKGAEILSKEEGQGIANELNCIIHLALGNVYVGKDGIPIVKIQKDKEDLEEAITTDYSNDPSRKIPLDTEGWITFRPDIDVVFNQVNDDAKSFVAMTQQLSQKAQTLNTAQNPEIDLAFNDVRFLVQIASSIMSDVESLKNRATSLNPDNVKEQVGSLRDQLDLTIKKDFIPTEECVMLLISKQTLSYHSDTNEINSGGGWDSDIEIEETISAIDATTFLPVVQQKAAPDPAQPLVQRMLMPVFNHTPSKSSEDKKLEAERETMLTSLERLKKRFREEESSPKDLSRLQPGETLRILGHGNADIFEDYSAKDFANFLIEHGLPEHVQHMEFYACSLDSEPTGFAKSLLSILHPRFQQLEIQAADSILVVEESGQASVYPQEMSRKLQNLSARYDQKIEDMKKEYLNKIREEEQKDWDAGWDEEEKSSTGQTKSGERLDQILVSLKMQYEQSLNEEYATYEKEEDTIYNEYKGENTRSIKKVQIAEGSSKKASLDFFNLYGVK